MQEETVTREIDATAEQIVPLVEDTQSFMDAAGFDAVRVEDGQVRIQNRVGLFDVELIVDVVDESDAILAYEQAEGIFEEMYTEYTLEETDDGATISAKTTFEAVDLPIVGQVLDATVVKRQRSSELNAQFDWLETQVT